VGRWVWERVWDVGVTAGLGLALMGRRRPGGEGGGSTAAGAGGLGGEAEGTDYAVQGVRIFGHLDTSETTNYSHPKMAS